MTFTCVRRVQFCAGHRVTNHESKCANLHGHNYVALIHAEPEDGQLDDIGRVVDFSVLKEAVGGWIDTNWDHGLILWEGDRETIAAIQSLYTQKLFLLPENPTAENMAKFLVTIVCPAVLKGKGVRVVKVDLWETENCLASYVRQ